MPTARPYQQEDVDSAIAKLAEHQCVIGRAATGLGKAVELAMLAQHYARFGRVMVLVDVEKLVRQLAQTIEWWTGTPPGIEMGERRCNNDGGFFSEPDRIVVSTVQSQYSDGRRGAGQERYRQFDPNHFSALLLDECELFLAPAARQVVEYYRSNPRLRVFGCTATPMRTDGIAMGELFSSVAFDRDILWGISEGWLVPARQAFVRVSVDFASLKVRKSGDDEDADYSADEIARRIENEQVLVELAKGIVHVAGDRKSIVVCPDVATARAVAHYLDGERAGCARCVYGELGPEEKDDVRDGHARGDFQFMTSVMMLTKGYDDPSIRAIFNCRKTRSKRLYTQIFGRGTRPLKGLLDGMETAPADDRREAILFSDKPNMLMVNMVGVDDDVRDITIIDILGKNVEDRVREAAKRIMATSKDPADLDPDAVIRAAKQKVATDDRAAEERRRAEVEAEVEVEYVDDLNVGAAGLFGAEHKIPPRTVTLLRNNKVPDDMIFSMDAGEAARLASRLVGRHKAGLCTFAQGQLLRKHGYGKDEVSSMTKAQAKSAIDELAANRWRRPKAGREIADAMEAGEV